MKAAANKFGAVKHRDVAKLRLLYLRKITRLFHSFWRCLNAKFSEKLHGKFQATVFFVRQTKPAAEAYGRATKGANSFFCFFGDHLSLSSNVSSIRQPLEVSVL